MNIVIHVQELTTKATNQINELKDRVRDKSKEREGLLDQIGKIEKASRTAADAGVPLDLQKTELRLAGLRSQITALDVEIAELDAATNEALAEQEALGPIVQLAELCRDKLKQAEIPELKSLTELHTLLQAKLVFEAGEATGCRLWLGEAHSPIWQATLPVKAAKKRMLKGAVPQALNWVPHDWLPVQPHERISGSSADQSLLPAPTTDLAQLYYIAEEDDFRSLTEALAWEVNEERQVGANHWERRTETVRVTKRATWGAPDDCLTAWLSRAFADKVVDLDAGEDAEVLPGLRAAILAATQAADEVTYVPASEAQTMVEIEKSIGKQFRAFIDSPWTPDTRGLLAKFKYYCEQGERPRFYNLNVAGAYGFRLRTRDHSWIQGYVYVVPENLAYDSAPTKVPEVKTNYSASRLLRFGRLILETERESQD